MSEVDALRLALVVVGALAVWALAAWLRARSRIGRRNRRRQRCAQRGERAAEVLLARLGYVVEERQATGGFTMWVDGEPRPVTCRADLRVRDRRGQRFVAEVKTGERAPDPTLPATRRQLLEYALAFDVDGVLLLDMETGVIHTVEFPQRSTGRRDGRG